MVLKLPNLNKKVLTTYLEDKTFKGDIKDSNTQYSSNKIETLLEEKPGL